MKRLMIAAALIFSATLGFGSEMDALVKKLVEKGILTQGEAYKIVAEAKEESRKQEVMVQKEMDSVPGWIKNTKFKGDARLRFENHGRSYTTGAPITDRSRTRVRFRWGFDTKVNDQIQAGLRLATGDSSQASSANQTFTNAFDDKNFWLDRAYIKYSPVKNFSLTGGKMSNPFYTSALVWSSDISPEGVIMQAKFPVASEIFATAGYFPIKEFSKDSNDPYMIGLQLGYAGKIADASFKAAATYYNYEGLKGSAADEVSPSFNNKGNSLAGGNYVYDYSMINVAAEITPFKVPMGANTMPVKIFGDYVKNNASDVEFDTGYLFGVKFGGAKKQGTWELGYDYRNLEADAIPEFMADGSFAEGGTDCRGHNIGFKYALSDNSKFGVSYMIAEGLGNTPKKQDLEVNTLQVNYEVAF